MRLKWAWLVATFGPGVRAFITHTPNLVKPLGGSSLLIPRNPAIKPCSDTTNRVPILLSSSSSLPTAPQRPKKPFTTHIVSWLASKLVKRITREVWGLNIDVGARSNKQVLQGDLPRVQVRFL